MAIKVLGAYVVNLSTKGPRAEGRVKDPDNVVYEWPQNMIEGSFFVDSNLSWSLIFSLPIFKRMHLGDAEEFEQKPHNEKESDFKTTSLDFICINLINFCNSGSVVLIRTTHIMSIFDFFFFRFLIFKTYARLIGILLVRIN